MQTNSAFMIVLATRLILQQQRTNTATITAGTLLLASMVEVGRAVRFMFVIRCNTRRGKISGTRGVYTWRLTGGLHAHSLSRSSPPSHYRSQLLLSAPASRKALSPDVPQLPARRPAICEYLPALSPLRRRVC